MQLIHSLSNSKFSRPTSFNNPFYYEADELCKTAFSEVVKHIESQSGEFLSEARKGKMFGVLMVECDSELGFLAAYSGQINQTFETEYFVPAIFDYLDENGYFKIHEREISEINHKISDLEDSIDRKALELALELARKSGEKILSETKAEFAESKKRRDEKRSQNNLDPETEQQLIKESQFQKAEINRIKQRVKAEISAAENNLKAWDQNIQNLKTERKQKSDDLQRWLFSQFQIINYIGESKNLLEIFNDYNGSIPPSGSGECCAPKLLQYAFKHGLRPITMAEFWYGESPRQEIRRHLNFYPACNGKCKPILNFMLRGLSYPANPLEISKKHELKYIYEDDEIIVVNKPAGMLSVPGKSDLESVLSVITQNHGNVNICHRLDMATSGLLVLAKSNESYDNIQRQFENHTVKKRYVAILSGIPIAKKGKITLPLIPDINDRPRQKVDFENGKQAITEYQVIEERGSECLVHLFPHTGRTHQLRVHCAHQLGLNIPIKGDELYGAKSERLYLHAEKITFVHPKSGKRITFEAKAEF